MIRRLIHRVMSNQALVAVLLLGSLLQIATINSWSYWFDEAFTSELIRFGYTEIPYRTGLDVHPPLYYLVLKAWSDVTSFIDLDTRLRLLSVVFMSISTLLSYKLVARLADRKAAVLAALAVATGPYVVRYGMEARMYAMVSTMLLGMSLLFVRRMQEKGRSVLDWVGYSLLLAACLYSHYFSVLILIPHGLYVLMTNKEFQLDNPPTWTSLLKTGFARSVIFAFIMYVPWMPKLFSQFTSVITGFWIPDVDLLSIPNTLSQMLSFHGVGVSLSLVNILHMTGLVLMAAALYKWRQSSIEDMDSRLEALVLIGPLVLGSVFLLLYSMPPFTSSVYTDRYLGQFSPLFYSGLALIGYRLYRLRRFNWSIALGAVMVVGFMSGIVNVYGGTGGAYGDGRPGDKTLDAVEAIKRDRLDKNQYYVVGESYWQYYSYNHHLANHGGVFVHDDADIDNGGAVLLRDRSEVLFDAVGRSSSDTKTAYYAHKSSLEDPQLGGEWRFTGVVYDYNGQQISRYELP